MTRAIAIRALVRIEGGAYANVALPAVLRKGTLATRDRAAVTEWVYGTVRWQRTLDWFLAPCLDRAVAKLDPPVRAALRLGAYQLWSGMAPHAAVAETVAAAGQVTPRAKGFVNAVLRKLAAIELPWAVPEGEDVTALGIRASVPDWIVQLFLDDLGRSEANAVLESLNEPAEVTMRINPIRATVDAVEAELRTAGASVSRGALIVDSLLVHGAGDIGALAAVRDGRATPQDQSSQAVAAVVGAGPGDRVLEIGAAPGGKASALAEAMADHGLVVAVDVHPARTAMIRTGARRLRLETVAPVVADGRRLPLRDASFDRVLLDAPCSGLGVLRRRPEARAGGSGPRPSTSWPRCSGRCWERPPRPSLPVGVSCIRCARSAVPRPSGSTSGPRSHSRGLRRRTRPAPPGTGSDGALDSSRAPRTAMGCTAWCWWPPGNVRGMAQKIAPSILAADFAFLADEVAKVAPVADLLHVDVMDGHFVPNISIGAPVVRCLRPQTDLYLDCHLMIENPGDFLEDFAKAGANSCTVHIELGEPRPLFERMRGLGMRVGLVLNPDTPLEAVTPYLAEIDILLFMSVHPGFGGQAFIPEVLDKVRAARTIVDEHGLPVELEIDGGINLETAPLAAAAGADILVAGSAVFRAPDTADAARAIRSAAWGGG